MKKVKSKGAYFYPETDGDYEGIWNKDFSSMVVQKSIRYIFQHNYKAEDVVQLLTDPFDYMLRYKSTGGAKVYLGDDEMPKTVRYYVSKTGKPMKKISKPRGEIGQFKRRNKLTDKLFNSIKESIPEGSWDERIHTKNKSKYTLTTTAIQSGRLIKECNIATKFDWDDVDYSYYIDEIKKLIIGERHV